MKKLGMLFLMLALPVFAQEKPAPEEEPPPMPDVDKPEVEREKKFDDHRHHHDEHGNHVNTRRELFGAFDSVMERVGHATVRVLCDGKPVALGTVVDAEGHIATKASQLEGKITCKTPDGEEHEAAQIGSNREYDLALLKIDAPGLDPVVWRAGKLLAQGCWLVAQSDEGNVLSAGVVGTDPREAPGRKHSANSRGFLGVSLHDSTKGVRVRTVLPDTAAEKAGLKVGDIIAGVKDRTFDKTTPLINFIGSHKEGEELEFSLIRGEEMLSEIVVLGSVPSRVKESEKQRDRWGGGPFNDRRVGFPAVIPHDLAVGAGDCGGPVFDIRGRCVGINIARAIRVANYAVTAEDAQRIIEELKSK